MLFVLAVMGGVTAALRLLYGLGATTALSDEIPWGFWKVLNMIAGVALATGRGGLGRRRLRRRGLGGRGLRRRRLCLVGPNGRQGAGDLVHDCPDDGARVLDRSFLATDEAQGIYENYGFIRATADELKPKPL